MCNGIAMLWVVNLTTFEVIWISFFFSDQNDPFNREALSLDMVIPHAELQEKIEAWKEEHRNKSW